MLSEPVRVQKYIADSGFSSRRTAEALIASGEVWVNGKAAVLGQKVTPGVDKVVVSGKVIADTAQPRITLAMNKPRGLVCSNEDPRNPDTIFTVLPKPWAKFRFFCAGRLDKDSEGLVILTTDGALAHRLMHPSSAVIKRYHVNLKEEFPASKTARLVKGITIEGEKLKVERATLINPGAGGSSRELDIAMHHGRKREIRRLFTALGWDVKRLRRYQIGAMRLRGIPLRAVKQLSISEIELLFRAPRFPS